MSILSLFGGWKTKANRTINGVSAASMRVSDVLDGANARLGSLWDGGFVGIDVNNYTMLTDDIERFVEDMEDITSSFVKRNSIEGALKGKTAVAVSSYIEGVNQALAAYLSFFRSFNTLIHKSVESMIEADRENSNVIVNEAEDVKSAALNIRVDE